jgi:putative ABC transport system permease protein
MQFRRLISRSFFHYLKGNMLAGGGLAVATAVITGAFIIGDSLSHSLERAVIMRLGGITHSVTAGERLFTMEMGDRFAEESGHPVSSALVAEGMAISGDGTQRLNRIQVIGTDDNFSSLLGSGLDYSAARPGEAIVSENMASRLGLEVGDFLMLRMKRAGVIPMNTPLVSDADQSVTRRVMVAAIAGDDDYGRFNLRISQTAPFNVFVNAGWLNTVMGLDGMANILLVAHEDAGSGELEEHLATSFRLEDGNLSVSAVEHKGMIEISSERVFIEEYLSGRLDAVFPDSDRVLTYFVNSLEKDDNDTPYSFIAATGRYGLEPGQVVINGWLADDLGAGAGDTLLMRYWETGARRELTERETSLVVEKVIGMDEAAADSVLMPFLPGLSDAGSCRDWDAGVPVELGRIRDEDEDYWDDYRGTPKAYISLEEGQRLWTNRFGNLTSVWLPGGEDDITAVREAIETTVDPLQTGFQVNELRERGLESAAAGVDFGMLFGGLGFFVMLAGIMLFFLLMLFNLEKRSGQVRLFSSLGYSRQLIRKIYLAEGMLVAVAGGVGGLLLAAGYGELVRYALTGVWKDIVRTELLVLVVRPSSLGWGLAISLSLALLVITLGINRYILKGPGQKDTGQDAGKKTFTGAPDEDPEKGNSRDGVPARNAGEGNYREGIPVMNSIRALPDHGGKFRFSGRLMPAAALLCAGGGLAILALQLFSGRDTDPVGFFISGGLLLAALLMFSHMALARIEKRGFTKINMTRLSIKNLSRNRTRSLSVITLLALGMFVIIATGSFRKDAATAGMHPEGGTGGFLFLAEATVPVLHNLNTRETQLNLNIPEGVSFVQFLAGYADDASCLNLNEVPNPRILATDPALLEGRFSFVTGTGWLDRENPWQSLNRDPNNAPAGHSSGTSASGMAVTLDEEYGSDEQQPAHNTSVPVIPAIADQAVIQWGLNKRVGDTLLYTDERGREIGLLLIGGLANSVFQGNVIVSEEYFLRHFPSTSGSSLFLVDAGHDRTEELREELDLIFRDHGWEMTTAAERLNEFNSVENTYLGIFMMLGALGVLLGVAGLAVVMARSIAERRTEIALYASLGYKRSQIMSIILREYLVLLGWGLAVGVPPAVTGALPSLLPETQQMNHSFLAMIIAAIFLHGVFWIVVTSFLMIRDKNLTSALRND